MTCPQPCGDQNDLTAFDMNQVGVPQWVERVPSSLTLSQTGIEETTVDGNAIYSIIVQSSGASIVFQIPKGTSKGSSPPRVVRLDGDSVERFGEQTYDGRGGYHAIEDAGTEATLDGVSAAGVLSNYRVPVDRQKLSYYVAPNSIAVHYGDDGVSLAGVTYDGDLVIYRLRSDGTFEDDPNFDRVNVGESNCVSAIGFGGDGNSVLIRHADGDLRYVIRNGVGVDWRSPTSSSGAALQPASEAPKTQCDAPDTSADVIRERIVAADPDGHHFALLDKTGAVYWVNIIETEQAGGQTSRDIGILKRVNPGDECTTERDTQHCNTQAATAVTWIAGDPGSGRAALVSAGGVDVVPYGLTTNASREVRQDSASTNTTATRTDTAGAAAATRVAEGPQKLPRRGEAKAASFDRNGDLAVAFGDGMLATFGTFGGTWTNLGETVIPKANVGALIYADQQIMLADDAGRVLDIDPSSQTVLAYGRAPANPSVYAVRPDGQLLSIEWDTDSVSVIHLTALPNSSNIDRTARLVSMRSPLQHESEGSLDTLIIDHQMELSLASGPQEPAPVDCAAEERRFLSALERDLFIGDSAADAETVPECAAGSPATASLQAADLLFQRARMASSIRQLVDDGAFSAVLQAAASGDTVAKRTLGAVLTRIALERGELSRAVIAKDAIRFGTNLPPAILKAMAAGAPIDPALVAVAREHAGFDPAVHELIAHWDERQINDLDAQVDALFEFSVAERLYRDAGDLEEQEQYAASRRAQLARVLPDDRVLDVMDRVEKWTPPPFEFNTPADLPPLPAAPADRRELDMQNADKILGDSPLLAGLRTELVRAHIFDFVDTDPKKAASMLIDLGRQTGGASGWSPDLVNEYLTLAEDISGGDAAPSAFQLATEAMKIIGLAFTTPIHGSQDTAELYRRAADLITANVGATPRSVVAPALKAINLSLVDYSYGSLPGIGVEPDVTESEKLLEATARMAGAIADNVDDGDTWKWLQGVSLFWQGVLVDDNDFASGGRDLQAERRYPPPACHRPRRRSEGALSLRRGTALGGDRRAVQRGHRGDRARVDQPLQGRVGRALDDRRYVVPEPGRRRLRLRACQSRPDHPRDEVSPI